MDVSEFLKTVKGMRGQKPAVIAMTLMATPAGMKVIQGAMKTKARVDGSLRGMWDFLGIPSYSDRDKVERSIGRIAMKLREIDTDLEALEKRLDAVDRGLESGATAVSASASPGAVETAATEAPVKSPASMTQVIDLLEPKKSRARRAAPAPAAKGQARPARPAESEAKRAQRRKPLLAGAAPTSAGSMLDLRIKK